MSANLREKFSSQAAPEVLAELRKIADAQGRQFQAVLDDALRAYIDRFQQERPRRHVMGALAESVKEFDQLYRELAK
jgi:hypothetical protein